MMSSIYSQPDAGTPSLSSAVKRKRLDLSGKVQPQFTSQFSFQSVGSSGILANKHNQLIANESHFLSSA
jgi:hypothetical protein